jgi:hypothetical protein
MLDKAPAPIVRMTPIADIRIGERHRKDMGNLDELAAQLDLSSRRASNHAQGRRTMRACGLRSEFSQTFSMGANDDA